MLSDRLIRLLAELLAGLQAPLSVGVLGEAQVPYRKLRDELGMFGWMDADAVEALLKHQRAKEG